MRSAPARGRRGRSPASTGSGSPPRALARNSSIGSRQRSVCLSPGGSLGSSPSVPKGHGARRRRGRSGSPARPLLSRPADVERRRPRTPAQRLTTQVAAGIVLVVVLGLRVPEQHGWGSSPARPRRAADGTRAGSDLQATCQQRCSPRGPPALLLLWTAQGAGPHPGPPPGRAATAHLVTRTGAPSGSERASRAATASVRQAGIWPGAAPSRPRGWGPGNRPRGAGVFLSQSLTWVG